MFVKSFPRYMERKKNMFYMWAQAFDTNFCMSSSYPDIFSVFFFLFPVIESCEILYFHRKWAGTTVQVKLGTEQLRWGTNCIYLMATLIDEIRISRPSWFNHGSVFLLSITLNRTCSKQIFFLCSSDWNGSFRALTIQMPQLSNWL